MCDLSKSVPWNVRTRAATAFLSRLGCCFALLAGTGCSSGALPSTGNCTADTLYYNGKIITMWPELPIAEAVSICGDRILAVGTLEQVETGATERTQRVDLGGQTMVPGLIDSHVHPVSAGLAELDATIPVMRSFAEIRQHVEEAVQATPEDQLIFVPKVYSTRLRERRYPTRHEMDEYSGSHLVMLDNGYASALNTAALRAAGITRRTRDPNNGKIIRDSKTGEPTGLILGARQLLSQLLQRRSFSDDDRLWALREMQGAYNQAGITSVIDGAQGASGLRLYQRLWEQEEMTVRTSVVFRIDAEAPMEEIREQILNLGVVSGFGDEFLRIGPLKFSLDGGILIGTAYLREPYGQNTQVYGYSDPDYRGVLRIPREKAVEIVKAANRLGWRVTAHTTGGGSTDVLLDAFEEADRELSIQGRRFSMIHANFPDARVLQRAARLGVILDMQPAWYHLDGPALSEVLGPERMKTFHPYRSALDAGVVVAGGSDHMIKFDSRLAINPYQPFYGMWMVVTRKTADGTVYNPEEKITREEALRLWTWNGAYNAFEEDVKGSIEPGKLADLTVISKDYLTCPEDEIKDIEALRTVLGGKVVYEKVMSEPTTWHLDNLQDIAGNRPTTLGNPRVIEGPDFRAVQFDGVQDALIFDTNPLRGCTSFTVEAVFRPDPEGSPEQRFLHLQEVEDHRVLLETRLTPDGKWFLDTFIKSGESERTLYAKQFLHPVGGWFHAALVYENGRMRHFVNGSKEMEGVVNYRPMRGGETSVGCRLNRVYWFKGAIRSVRITPRALSPDEFMEL